MRRRSGTRSLPPWPRRHRWPGGSVVEEVVRLGPRGLFGIVSRPAAGSAVRSSVVLADTATSYRVGPARTWVTLARSLAARGHRVVRFDHHDLGDSPLGSTPAGPRYYTQACVRDVREAAEASDLRGDGVPLVLVGHCSGSWASLMAARGLHPDALYLVNPLIWISNPPTMGPAVTGAAARAAGTASLSWKARHWVRSMPPVRLAAQTARNTLVRVGTPGFCGRAAHRARPRRHPGDLGGGHRGARAVPAVPAVRR